MIDIHLEKLVSFPEAARLLPRRRRGRKPHVATLYRWASRGLRGHRLETIRVGGSLCTSVEALQRFFDKLTDRESARTHLHDRGDIEAAELELDRLGVGS